MEYSTMSPITTINSLSAAEIRTEVKEMRAFAKELAASKTKARKFFDAVRKACGEDARPLRSKP